MRKDDTNSFNDEADNQNFLEKFEDTCPLLLQHENQINPYLEIESFFSGASLAYYRTELRSWFKISMTVGMQIEDHANLIYFNNQLVQLLHAGYLIVSNDIEYIASTDYSSKGMKFKEWINEVKKQEINEGISISNCYEIHLLSKVEIANPLFFLNKIITLKRVWEIRYGLQEWIYCSFNKNSSIATMDAKYVFNLFQDLEKIFEMLLLLITN